ncbi:UNVERIFIED_CONTAM: hypothetical protein FKN15_008152, partial [Acipenser sinensis]
IQFHYRLIVSSPILLAIPAIRLTLRGISESSPPTSPSRLPTSSDHINLAKRLFQPLHNLLMEVMCLTAFFGFLRCSEYTVPSLSSFPSLGICSNDISLVPDSHFLIMLCISKTDQLCQGQFIQLSKINSPLCPFTSMSRYIYSKKPFLMSDPLFTSSSPAVVTRHWFSTQFASLKQAIAKAGLSPQFYTPHSFRIAAKPNINPHLIKSLERWSFSAVESYIRTSVSDIAAAHKKIVCMPGVGAT